MKIASFIIVLGMLLTVHANIQAVSCNSEKIHISPNRIKLDNKKIVLLGKNFYYEVSRLFSDNDGVYFLKKDVLIKKSLRYKCSKCGRLFSLYDDAYAHIWETHRGWGNVITLDDR